MFPQRYCDATADVCRPCVFLLRRPHVCTLNRPVVFSPQVQAAAAAGIRNVWHGDATNRATNRATGEMVAIKMMKRRFAAWEECVSLREVSAE